MNQMFDNRTLDLRFIRVCRVLRVSKILRVFRAFRFLFELRLMVSCVLGSLVSLMWAGLLLMLVLMIFALIFVESLIEFRIENPDLPEITTDLIDQNFGSVMTGMVKLFSCTTGGEDWHP